MNHAASDEQLGPIDYLVIEFSAGRFTEDDCALLLDAVNHRTVRVLDLEFVHKDAGGDVRKVELNQLANPAGIELSVWDGASSGLLDEADVTEVGAAIEPGSVAAILIYENLWETALADRLEGHGARLIGDGRIDPEAVLAALDLTESH